MKRLVEGAESEFSLIIKRAINLLPMFFWQGPKSDVRHSWFPESHAV